VDGGGLIGTIEELYTILKLEQDDFDFPREKLCAT
jgi:hypothetical protein